MPQYPNHGYRVSAKRAGFQRPSAARGFQKPLVPANDNWAMPRPANDNAPGLPNPKNFAKSVFRLGLGTALRYGRLGMDLGEMATRMYNPLSNQPYYMSGGWTARFWPPCPGGKYPLHWNGSGYNACIGGQASAMPGLDIYQNPKPLSIAHMSYSNCPPFPAAGDYDTCLAFDPTGGSDRWQVNMSYNRNPTMPAGAGPLPHYSYGAFAETNKSPWLDPEELPILQWVPFYKPLPVRQLAAVAKVREKQMEWSAPNRWVPRPKPVPVVPFIRPELTPFAPHSGVRIQLYPRLRVLPGTHVQAPPPKGTKERKFILAALPSSIEKLINAATETSDSVDAIYYAIPKERRPKWPNGKARKLGLHQKAKYIWDNYDLVDYNQMMTNLIDEYTTDRAYGYKGRLTRAGNEATGFATSVRNVR